MQLPFGFIIRGATSETRRLADASAAFRGYCSLDERADANRETYLSAFQFGDDFRELLEATDSCKGFAGACCSPWLWFDIDRDDLGVALADARRLASFLIERYRLDDDAILIFFSGSKGFHIGLPTSLWMPMPSVTLHTAYRRFAERIGQLSRIAIDTAVYDCLRAFRAPNSRHPKTSLHKRRLTLDELLGLSLDGIRELAKTPQAFDVPTPPAENEIAKADWLAAQTAAREESEGKNRRREAGQTGTTLNRATLDFIRDGAGSGERHVKLFSAAANLAEFGCPPILAHTLLTEAALDSGLSPLEVRRQIECGLKHVGPTPPADGVTPIEPPPPATTTASPSLRIQLAGLWGRQTPAVEQPGAGDAFEPPLGQSELTDSSTFNFPFGANDNGPYGTGDKR